MGTRADFYIGIGRKSEWIGSIAWDGYPRGIPESILSSDTIKKFRRKVSEFLTIRDDATTPDKGWPWPWDNSKGTDFTYSFHRGKVYASEYGGSWFDPLSSPDGAETIVELGVPKFPNMSKIKNVTLGRRSGLIVAQT